MIKGSINTSKIDKAKLFEGKKGKYLDIVLIETPNNKYGDDYMIVQSTEKDEESIILGNARILKKGEPKDESKDDLPF